MNKEIFEKRYGEFFNHPRDKFNVIFNAIILCVLSILSLFSVKGIAILLVSIGVLINISYFGILILWRKSYYVKVRLFKHKRKERKK